MTSQADILSRYDFVISDDAGHVNTLIDVKAVTGRDVNWAKRYIARREQSEDVDADYFLLVTLDRLFLWKLPSSDPSPDHVIDARPLFKPYFDRMRSDHESLTGAAFELLVASWLDRLLLALEYDPDSIPEEHIFTAAGWTRAIRRGRVEHELAA